MSAVLVFDADNTLWDTNDVFRRAQLDLLGVLAKEGLMADSESQLDTLRELDRELISRLGSFEYEFRLLSAAVTHFYYHELTPEEAVRRAVSSMSGGDDGRLSRLIDDSYHAYEEALRRIPRLYPDTEEVLSLVQKSRSEKNLIVTVIFSDGKPSRLERILRAHGIRGRGLFDEIVIGRKSKEAFEKTKELGARHLPNYGADKELLFVMTGDSLKRDIKFGNQTGYVTVYKPANFHGHERPFESDEQPHFTIARLIDLLPILRELGVAVIG